jgi:DNA adenine methylase
MSGNRSKLIAFNYFGGKFTWLEYLYSHFPDEFIHLVDLFGGSFFVSLNYPKKIIKTANEINGEITNFFQVLRDHPEELIKRLELTPCSNLEYQRSWELGVDNIENARKFYVRHRQSFYGLGSQNKNKGWQMAKMQVNATGGESVSKWNNAIPKLYFVAQQIRRNFQITNLEYIDCIDRLDFPGAFFYCDPPYPRETRASFDDYKFEFSTEKHIQLAERLHRIEGKAMISSYNSQLYNDLYADWEKIEFPIKKNNIRSSKVQEVIWMNYKNEKHDLFSN